MKTYLSCDGGGLKGLIILEVLKYIESRSGKPIQKLFSGIAGTSTGSIITLGLAKKNPLSASELSSLYLSSAKTIFPNGFMEETFTLDGFKHTKYPADGLEKLLKDTFGTATMGDLECDVCIPTFDATAFDPICLGRINLDWQLWEAARASSAGPTFFDPFEKYGHAYVDGGMFANNPAMEAITRWVDTMKGPPSAMLSIGTGAILEGWKPEDLRDLGVLRWLPKLVSIFTDGQVRDVEDSAPDYFSLGLGNYLRLQPQLPAGLGDMDQTDPAKLRSLCEIGVNLVNHSKDALDAFIARM